MIRRIAAVVVVVAAATALTWWLARVEQVAPEQPADPVSVRVRQATIVVRHRGNRQAEIAADRVDVSADRRLTTFAGKTRAVFYEGGAPAVTATGGRIVLDRVTQAVRVDGGLRLTMPHGETLTAETASWDQDSRVIELVGNVMGQAAPAAPRTSAPGQPGMGQLRADRIRYDTRTRVVTASGNVILRVGETEMRADRLRIETEPQIATAEGRVTVSQRESRVAAPAIRYELRTERAEATGGVVLEQQGATVRAPQMRFDLRSDVTDATGGVEVVQGESTLHAPSVRFEGRNGDVTADGGITLVQPGSRVTGARLRANLPSKRADVRGDVTFVRSAGQPSGPPSGPAPGPAPSRPSPAAAPAASPSSSDRVVGALAKEETIITAGRLVFRWDVNEAEAEDSVVARQRDKTAWADRMVYSESSNRLLMVGNVILEQTSGDWLVREGVAPSPREPAERQALASVTRVTCTRLTMTLRERDIVAEGPLTVNQKNRSASGDRGVYTEATRLLVVTGNVKMQDADGQRLRADRVVISLVEETFDAEGNVQTEFVIRSSPTGGAGPSDRPSPTPRP